MLSFPDPNGTTLHLLQGDITKMETDAIVNAANSSLLGGGGVDGAIHRAGGPRILDACRIIGGCKTGQAVITTGGDLPAPYVIHTVGPVWRGGGNKEAELLADCYYNSLALAVDKGLTTIAFPNISTGIYSFPKPAACKIAIQAVRMFLEYIEGIKNVYFVCFDAENYTLYERFLHPTLLAETIIREIETAFDGVPAPEITWGQADLLDDYIDHGPAWEKAKQTAWRGRWQDIPAETLRPASALSFLKPEGIRYYFPACMVLALRAQPDCGSDLTESTLFHAEITESLKDYFLARFEPFSPAQKKAVLHFLDFFAFVYDHPNAQRAIDKYWADSIANC